MWFKDPVKKKRHCFTHLLTPINRQIPLESFLQGVLVYVCMLDTNMQQMKEKSIYLYSLFTFIMHLVHCFFRNSNSLRSSRENSNLIFFLVSYFMGSLSFKSKAGAFCYVLYFHISNENWCTSFTTGLCECMRCYPNRFLFSCICICAFFFFCRVLSDSISMIALKLYKASDSALPFWPLGLFSWASSFLQRKKRWWTGILWSRCLSAEGSIWSKFEWKCVGVWNVEFLRMMEETCVNMSRRWNLMRLPASSSHVIPKREGPNRNLRNLGTGGQKQQKKSNLPCSYFVNPVRE